MKIISRWKVRPGALPEIVKRYKSGAAGSIEGATLLHRWMRVDMTEGISVYEVTDPAALLTFFLKWADLLDSESFPVLEESEGAPILLKSFPS
jgi:hypothetical protein